MVSLRYFYTYIFVICILSASFCRPKSCHGRLRLPTHALEPGELLNLKSGPGDEPGPDCRCVPKHDESSRPELA